MNEDGSALQTTNDGHNTHGSIELINDQWYAFYHRPPRGFGFARQPMVAPIKIEYDEKSVADGGVVTIRAYDPYAEDEIWTVKDSRGYEYTGAEVTSEGFHIYGLDPYRYYSAGYACYLSNTWLLQDSWDIWDNHMPIANVGNGAIIGYKYFGFGGLSEDTKGLKAFEGSKPGNNTVFNLFINPKTDDSFKINVWLDGPWDNDVWKGKKIGEIIVPANATQEITQFDLNVAEFVDNLDKKHALFLVAEGNGNAALFDMIGLGFSSDTKKIERPVVPTVSIQVNGEELALPGTPIRSTNANGITGYDKYEVKYKLDGTVKVPKVKASSDNKSVKIKVKQASSLEENAVVQFDYLGIVKTYTVVFVQE